MNIWKEGIDDDDEDLTSQPHKERGRRLLTSDNIEKQLQLNVKKTRLQGGVSQLQWL